MWEQLAGIGANLGLGYLAGQENKDAAQAAADAKSSAIAEAQALMEAEQIPAIQAMEIVLQNPQYANVSLEDSLSLLGDTQLKGVQTDALAADTRKKALLDMIQRADQGLDPIQKDMARQIFDQQGAQSTAAIKQLANQAAMEGRADSGTAEMQKLFASQAAANTAAQNSRSLLRDAYSQRINAGEAMGRMAREEDETAYTRGANIANKQDTISQLNQKYLNDSKQYDINRKDKMAESAANTANRQEEYNKGLIADDYNRRIGRATNIGKFKLGLGDVKADMEEKKSKGPMYQGIAQGIGTGINAYSQYGGNNSAPQGYEDEDEIDPNRTYDYGRG